MTKKSRSYRFLVAKPGEGDLTESTNIDLDVSTTDPTVLITGLDSFGGQRVRGVEAHAESLPWTVTLQESTAEEVTSKLATSTLLSPDMMRRTCRLDVSGDGGFDSGFDPDATDGFQIGAGGRVTDLAVNPDEQTYEFTVRDALFTARTAGAFSSNNTSIFPPAPSSAWGPAGRDWASEGVPDIEWEIVAEDTNKQTVDLKPFRKEWRLIPNVVDEIVDDVVGDPKAGQANFRNLRLRTDANIDAGIIQFLDAIPHAPARGLTGRAQQTDDREYVKPRPIRVQSSNINTSGNTVTGFLHAFGRDPSTVLPLHFGGRSGVDPMQFVKDRYDNANVRTPSTWYQTHSTNKPNAVLDHPLKLDDLYVRVTGPTTNLQGWLERQILDPHGVAPLVDDEGRIIPTYMRQPDSADIPQTSDLFTFASTNIAEYPTWDEGTKEQVTVVNYRADNFEPTVFDPPDTADGVNILELKQKTTFATSIFGEHQRTVRMHGFDQPLNGSGRISRDTFQRFGYGPIRTRFRGMSDASTVRAGDFVVLDIETLPKAPDAIRGGRQIFQVLSRTGTVRGPQFEMLELGPEAQPLPTVTLNLTKSSTEPKHAIDLNVTGLSSGANAQVRLAASSIEPSGTSDWTIKDIVIEGTSTTTRSGLPSGETIWGQARQTKTNRITGDWSTSASTVLDAIPGPSTLTANSTRADRIEYKWSNGSTDYPTQLLLASTVQKLMPGGSETGMVYEVESTGELSVAVRHVDEFGGKSSQYSTSVTMSTNIVSSPNVQNLTVSNGFFSGGSGSSLIFV